jgi:hypothetical protein
VTGLSAIIFAVLDPVPTPSGGALVPPHPPLGGNTTLVAREVIGEIVNRLTQETATTAMSIVRDLVKYAEEEAERNERGGQSNSIVYILRSAPSSVSSQIEGPLFIAPARPASALS